MHVLLDHGADVNFCDKNGDSALDMAIDCSQMQAAILLLEKGAASQRALYRAVGSGNKEMIKKLLVSGFKRDQRISMDPEDGRGPRMMTPSEWGLCKGEEDAVRFMESYIVPE
ncbi:hypothetical protein BU16DRAFT_556171 [Lophium mytilinum]|uniref:Uncharacterized protein n=1 Tax=Lophium mytilinum TaxID=390894 RepID=A0A6A6RE13_9PEZI|nr:hypothetical protein BU16DRAFT_556171 [Lophium mytilinum]